MIHPKLMLKDTSGKKSVTVTAFVVGFIVVNAKLLISGLTVAGYQMASFTGGEYAAAIGALGAVYVMRRYNNNNNAEEGNEQ